VPLSRRLAAFLLTPLGALLLFAVIVPVAMLFAFSFFHIDELLRIVPSFTTSNYADVLRSQLYRTYALNTLLIAAPTDEERAHPYLWRFWRHVPGHGRITIFDRDAAGGFRPVVVFNRRRGKKRQAKALKPLERAVRTLSNSNDSFASSYASRHRKSNRKHRNGWLRDLPLNLSKAATKGLKKYDFVRLVRA